MITEKEFKELISMILTSLYSLLLALYRMFFMAFVCLAFIGDEIFLFPNRFVHPPNLIIKGKKSNDKKNRLARNFS